MNVIPAAGRQPNGAAPRQRQGRAGPATGRAGWLRTYLRLSKAEFVLDYYLSVIVVMTAYAASAGSGFVWESLLTVGLFMLGQFGVVSAVMAFDDVNGFRDGSDQANYVGADGEPLRPLQRKPLLTGALTPRQATWFGTLALLWGAALWTLAAVQAAHRPWWALLAAGLVLVTSWQYSYGLKFSYRSLGEVLIAGCPMVLVIAPYGYLDGHMPALVLVEAVLFGLWQILVSAYSNTKDISGDKAVGRSTVAVRTSDRGNRRFIGALTATDLLLVPAAAAAGWAPWWAVAAMLPLAALRLRQYAAFLRGGDALLARRRGVSAFRTGIACLALVNLVHFAG
ncbi:UbiA family prenyltransferase [Streptomyces tubbatahanensis]|uniref:UbiA family prenyltransferase n=1 Tax=Streptomyces tubbatahanensis TaxID=2923272 RepID=A0ABY3XMR4_9ACTN|nr:UbiA family prenyltransferase [Streptomyces tubbatahanensis]UNS95726.1 UbiA family prenyltransferase [Streptomyces tubbatahanensis]